MYVARGLLILSFGSMLRFISCFSDGGLLEDHCQEMNIIHDGSAQDTESPFKVQPESVTLTETAPITVTLSGGSRAFMGFMLDSRKCDNCKSVGTFSLEDTDNSLLICGDKVVAHPNNLGKTSIRVSWTPEAAGLFFFRAAVVEDFSTFWGRKRIDLPSTTSPPNETSAHTILTTSPTTFPTGSHATAFLTGTSPAPTISEAISTQTNLTTSTTKSTTSNINSQATGTSPSPTISEANSTQTNLTTSTTKSTTSNINSQATGTSPAPTISEANSTQTNLTTSTTKFTTSNINSQATAFLTGTSPAPTISEANSAQTNLTTSTTKFTTSNIDSQATAFLTGTSPAPTISEANSAQTNLTTSTTKSTTSNIDSQTTATSSPPQCAQYMYIYQRCVLALLLFSRLCFLGGSSLLVIIRPVLKKTATISAAVLELASKTIAVILVLIKTIKYECVYECSGFRIVFTVLTVVAMVSSLVHTIIVFLHCGPSHELRTCWLCAIVMVDLINTTITTTAIFFGMWCFEEYWLPILMGVYVVLEIMFYLGSGCYEKYRTRKKVRKNQNHILERRISPWLIMFIIFTILNVMLTAALITGVSLVRMKN